LDAKTDIDSSDRRESVKILTFPKAGKQVQLIVKEGKSGWKGNGNK
jgi:hypothetical protein